MAHLVVKPTSYPIVKKYMAESPKGNTGLTKNRYYKCAVCHLFFPWGGNLKCFETSSSHQHIWTLEMLNAGRRKPTLGVRSLSFFQLPKAVEKGTGMEVTSTLWLEMNLKGSGTKRKELSLGSSCFVLFVIFVWEKWSHQIEHIQKRNDGMILMYTVLVDCDDHVMGDICVEGRLNIYWIHPRPVKEANEGF